MANMFLDVTLSTANYDSLLIGWNSLPSLQSDVPFNAGNSDYCLGEPARMNLINSHGWVINDGGLDCFEYAFVTTWKTDNPGSSGDDQITIPTSGGGYDYFIDWGDGNTDSGVSGDMTHTYAAPGTYTVRILGDFPRIYFNNQGDREKILSIDHWGNIPWLSMQNAFYGCSHLQGLASDVPDLSSVTDMSGMFREATSFNQDIGDWDVSHVTDMSEMFSCSTSFNQDIGDWDVSHVTDMSHMFSDSTSFNQDIGDWDVSHVTNMSSMFSGSNAFNQDIGEWDVSHVTDMTDMFFNYSLSTANYDSLLIGWNSLPLLQSSVHFNAGHSDYCLGETARMNLINTHGWVIDDGGLDCIEYAFVTTWKTDNPGSSGDQQITIPTSGGGYDYFIDWGDGNTDTGVSGNMTHTYAAPGTYTVRILGDFPRIYFNNQGDREKILSIDQWGSNPWLSMQNAFYGCSHLKGLASDVPDLSSVTDMSGMFREATSFNQDIGDWDISHVTDMSEMFLNDSLSTTIYDALLIGWNSLSLLQDSVIFDGGNSNYCLGETARMNLINTHGWVINDGGLDCFEYAFVTTWKTDNPGSSGDHQITIPTTGGGYDYHIDWGDGNTDTGVSGNMTHTYAAPGTYTVAIFGDFPRIYFNNQGDREKIISIDQWGSNPWLSMQNAFYGCSHLQGLASDIPDLSSVTDMSGMFREATSFNQDIGDWDVSHATDMSEMFSSATSYNKDIGGWDVSHVTNMSAMFSSATSFNQNIGDWDVSDVSDMHNMFSGAGLSQPHYDPLLVGWAGLPSLQNNVIFDAGTSMYCIGLPARNILTNTYNWTINDGGMSCTDPFVTTWQTTGGNEQITIPVIGGSNYNVDWGDGPTNENVTGSIAHTYAIANTYTVSIYGLFPHLYFNNTGDKLKIRSVEQWGNIVWGSMASAFYGCSNLKLNATDIPDLSHVTDLNSMFRGCTLMNGNISGWDVSHVVNMGDMFNGCSSFNQDISTWDVSGVGYMNGMFVNATSFDQNLGNWDISHVTTMNAMFLGAGMSTSNYDSTLIGWSGQPGTPTNIPFNGGSSQYCAVDAWNALDTLYNWTISDGGPSTYCCTDTTTFAGGAWNNGIPGGNSVAIFDDDYDSATDGGSIDACAVIIHVDKSVTIANGDYMNVVNTLRNEGDLTVQDMGSVMVHGEIYKH